MPAFLTRYVAVVSCLNVFTDSAVMESKPARQLSDVETANIHGLSMQ